MSQFIKKRITVFAIVVAMLMGFGSISNLTVYAAGTNATVSVDAKQIESLKTYKGNTTTFNAYDYYMNNVDLQTAIGADGDALLKHYNEYGKKEGRVAIVAKAAASTATAAASSKAAGKSASSGSGVNSTTAQQTTEVTYVLNTNTHKFHYPSCKDVKKIKEKNYATTSAGRDDVIAQGYSPCGHCHP